MFLDCGPSASDPVLDLGGFLAHEGDNLHQIQNFTIAKKYLDMHLVDLEFSQLVCLLV